MCLFDWLWFITAFELFLIGFVWRVIFGVYSSLLDSVVVSGGCFLIDMFVSGTVDCVIMLLFIFVV